MFMPKPNDQKKKLINEKLSYQTKCNQWRELKISGDVQALVQLTERSAVTVSKAINHGVGGIEVLRAIDTYFKDRMDSLPNSTEYLPNDRKNYLV